MSESIDRCQFPNFVLLSTIENAQNAELSKDMLYWYSSMKVIDHIHNIVGVKVLVMAIRTRDMS